MVNHTLISLYVSVKNRTVLEKVRQISEETSVPVSSFIFLAVKKYLEEKFPEECVDEN